MAWDGFFAYGSTEIISVPRTLAYAKSLNMPWVKDVNDSPWLRLLLGDAPYTTPSGDLAPWYDPTDGNSAEFAGLIPLSVTGIEDSTSASTPFEFTTDGGNPGRVRHGMKSVVFSVALVGKSECAVEYGFRWLKRALLKRRDCVSDGLDACGGRDLWYAKCKPVLEHVDPDTEGFILDGGAPDTEEWVMEVDGGTPSTASYPFGYEGGFPSTVFNFGTEGAWWREYGRHLRNVVFNNGPRVTGKRTIPGCEGVVWTVSFTATAGDPFEYGIQRPVLRALGDGTAPFVDGYSGSFGQSEYEYTGACNFTSYAPIFDPLCAALVTPPSVPSVAPTSCYDTTPGTEWDRWWAELPDDTAPLWDEVFPVFFVSGGESDQRMVKVRLYSNDSTVTDDCQGMFAEWVIQYLPANVTLVIDNAQKAVYAIDGSGLVRRADSLVFSSNAKPIRWYGVSCNAGFRVTLEAEDDTTTDLRLDLDLVPRTA